MDYTNDDQDERAEQDEDDEEYETVFYRSFEMQKVAQPKAFRAKGKGKKKEDLSNVETYTVGDTVLVKTDDLSLRKEPPSIGVIVAMWETRKKDSDEEFDSDRMRLRVHWFLRPAVNKPQHFGMKREHTKVSSIQFSTIPCLFVISERDILFLGPEWYNLPRTHSRTVHRHKRAA